MDNFVHLHLHSTYSFQDGFGLADQYIKRVKELGQPAVSVTDHGNVSSHYKWYQECTKNGIKPILGCELYIKKQLSYGEENDDKYYHLTVLAKNNEGYRNLLELVSIGWKTEERKPLISMEDVFRLQKGLIILSGCLSGKVLKFLTKNKDKEAEQELKLYKEKFDDFYVELQPLWFKNNKNDTIPNYTKLYHLAKKLNIPMVATADCHYVKKEYSYLQEILLCIQSNARMDDPKRWKFDQSDFYLKSREEMEQDFKQHYPDLDVQEALDNTLKIADMVDFTFPTASPLSFPIPQQEKDDQLWNFCLEGMKRLKFEGNKVYEERLKYEYDLIVKKNFVDYFLIVADMVMWAKNNGILVGPARGSSAGSLVCYLLRITEVDPIKYKLIFERFIDINREDLPDIDIDFEDEQRPEIISYLKEKYGENRVGQLATFSTFKGKSIISDFARIFNIPYGIGTKLKSIIIERSGGDSRASFTLEDTFNQFEFAKETLHSYPSLKHAQEFEGQLRNVSSHASGIIIANEPINNFCATYHKMGNISMDYHDASELGFTKFDILGLNTLTCISKALKSIKVRTGKEIDIYNLPLDDSKVFENFKNPKKLFGIFQFDGQAVNQVCRQILPETFEELSAINALSRPGPIHGIDHDLNKPITTIYIERKLGKLPFATAHPLLLEITKDTQGVVIYQEQVMRAMREIGKMSWEDTSEIRKNISRSKGVEAFQKFGEKFSKGAKENGLTDKETKNIWDALAQHGSWCISGDAKVRICGQNGFVKDKEITIKELFDNNGYATSKWKYQPDAYKKVKLLSVDFDGKIRPARIKNIYYNGIRETKEIITETGKNIKATDSHRFLTQKGYREVSSLKKGDLIAVNGGLTKKEYIKRGFNGKGWTKGLKWKNGKPPMIDGRKKEVVDFRKIKTGKSCDHCGETHHRMEVHHVTYNAPNSIMEWLCPGCHKKAEYKKGRVKVWEKGYNVKFEKIIRIAKYRDKKRAFDVYDIEMEDNSKPNFLVNDFVSHNSFNKSHSVSYSIISYWTMWLKTYYPIEYYQAMTSTMLSEDKIRKVIKEYIREGFELLPIDINKSNESFLIDGKNLRLGFLQIKGFGETTAKKIVENQPYVNIDDFEKRVNPGKKIMTLLSKMNAFECIGGANKEINTLFGKEKEKKWDESITFEEKIKICPLSLDFSIFENWSSFLHSNIKYQISKIENVNSENGNETIIGIAYDKNLEDKIEEALTRGKPAPVIENGETKYFNFILEDDTDFVNCRVSPKNFAKFQKLIFEEINDDSILMVKGRMGDGIRMFFCNEIVCLNHVKEKIDGKSNAPFTESELILMGKLWKKLK